MAMLKNPYYIINKISFLNNINKHNSNWTNNAHTYTYTSCVCLCV